MICPFTNAKLELALSRMNRVKTDRRSTLSRDRLDVLLRISEIVPLLKNLTLMQVLIADILMKFFA